jgi:hypothetical protein
MINPPKLFPPRSKNHDRMIGFLSPQILPYLSNRVQSLGFKIRSTDHDFLGYAYFIFRPAAYYFSLSLVGWITLAIRISPICHKFLKMAVLLAPLRWYRYQSLEFLQGAKPVQITKAGDISKISTTATSTTEASTSASATTTPNPQLSQNAIDNLESTEEEIEVLSLYFKPKPGKPYLIKLDPENKIMSSINDRFKDANGNSVRRWETKIIRVNSQKEQIWTFPKTVCLQLTEKLRKGYTVLRVTRNGSDRNTTYTIEGVE